MMRKIIIKLNAESDLPLELLKTDIEIFRHASDYEHGLVVLPFRIVDDEITLEEEYVPKHAEKPSFMGRDAEEEQFERIRKEMCANVYKRNRSMNAFEINIVGETPLNDEQIGKCLDAIHDYIEYVLRGECGIVYTPKERC